MREREFVEMKSLVVLQVQSRRVEEGAQMQLALNNLAARKKRFLNLACPLLLLFSQRNITVPGVQFVLVVG